MPVERHHWRYLVRRPLCLPPEAIRGAGVWLQRDVDYWTAPTVQNSVSPEELSTPSLSVTT